MSKKGRIGILTGGGDCPGINAVIRAVTKRAIAEYQLEVIGIEDGFEGIINNKHRKLRFKDVSGILTLGGNYIRDFQYCEPISICSG
jgi:6-phosphofructokinase